MVRDICQTFRAEWMRINMNVWMKKTYSDDFRLLFVRSDFEGWNVCQERLHCEIYLNLCIEVKSSSASTYSAVGVEEMVVHSICTYSRSQDFKVHAHRVRAKHQKLNLALHFLVHHAKFMWRLYCKQNIVQPVALVRTAQGTNEKKKKRIESTNWLDHTITLLSKRGFLLAIKYLNNVWINNDSCRKVQWIKKNRFLEWKRATHEHNDSCFISHLYFTE